MKFIKEETELEQELKDPKELEKEFLYMILLILAFVQVKN